MAALKLNMFNYNHLDWQKVDLDHIDQILTQSEARGGVVEQGSNDYQETIKRFYDQEDGMYDDLIEATSQMGNDCQGLLQAMTELRKQVTDSTGVIDESCQKRKTAQYQQEEKVDKGVESCSQQEAEMKNLNERRRDVIAQMVPKILVNLQNPSPANKNGELFNWILGCLYGERQRVTDFLSRRQTRVKQGGWFVMCGGNRERQAQSDPWYMFRVEVFQKNDGFEFLSLLRAMSPETVDPFQTMLTEELMENKKEVIRTITELDQKYQVKLLFEALELLQDGQRVAAKTQAAQASKQEDSEILKQRKESRLNYDAVKKDHDRMVVLLKQLEGLIDVSDKSSAADIAAYNEKKTLNNREYDDIERKIKLTSNATEKKASQEQQQIVEEDRQRKAQLLLFQSNAAQLASMNANTMLMQQAIQQQQEKMAQDAAIAAQNNQMNASAVNADGAKPDQEEKKENVEEKKVVARKKVAGDREEEEDKKQVEGDEDPYAIKDLNEDEGDEAVQLVTFPIDLHHTQPQPVDKMDTHIQKSLFPALIKKQKAKEQTQDGKKSSVFEQLIAFKQNQRR